VQRPPRSEKILRLRGCAPVVRKPFIEIELSNGRSERHSFAKAEFARLWGEATIIVKTLTDIDIVSEVRYQPDVAEEQLVRDILQSRAEAIDESMEMFSAGTYRVFLEQFGQNYTNLPAGVEQCIETARKKLR
jgi:hypothetical protein